MNEHGSIRNLEQLQEDDDSRRIPLGVTIALAALGGACVVFAALALGGRTTHPQALKADPLGDLVSQRSRAPSLQASDRAATELSPRDVTFPRMLSDDEKTSTALAAVLPGAVASSASLAPTQPPPASDRLPVVPLPAQALLEATPIVTRPRDPLTKAANDASQIEMPHTGAGGTPAGREGGYQLQVSSFHTTDEAQEFADQLRARGHKAYVVEAHVPSRGIWYRVRIGPFPTQFVAAQYRTAFEAREHVVPFIVAPETTAKAH
jgi:cell division septation protein DedD